MSTAAPGRLTTRRRSWSARIDTTALATGSALVASIRLTWASHASTRLAMEWSETTVRGA